MGTSSPPVEKVPVMPRKRVRLAQRRRAVGLSQERLAEIVSVDRSTVVRWERAETEPQPWHRPRLAQALRATIEELAELLADVCELSSAKLPTEIEAEDVKRRNLLAATGAGVVGALGGSVRPTVGGP